MLTGVVFGDYVLQLTVTGGDGNSATARADIGAVAMDGKGVVVKRRTPTLMRYLAI